ncbi:hypothetical protein [Amycolatopsis taiwanensis]|uniref:hypothetical protein n=1 Tax=Amycolatopsis taiwanensis TaxID=342230 RepID=UPI000484F693|nr:hypothetical protein [Amycolatopsis taiwanensis]
MPKYTVKRRTFVGLIAHEPGDTIELDQTAGDSLVASGWAEKATGGDTTETSSEPSESPDSKTSDTKNTGKTAAKTTSKTAAKTDSGNPDGN